jgi:EAL domain-containing protein (putative c-di-GMP-specific phosphodiesterase class I)
MRLFDGRLIRMRGARAANEENGEIERLVTFIEQVSAAGNGVNNARVRSATEAAIVPASADPMTAKLSAALKNGDIVAAFQPIVSLENEKIAGYEALARWRGQDVGAEEGPERFVRAAERIGKGGVLAATMLDQAAAFLADALKKEKRKDLFVAMNVSWGQIREESFLEAVREAVSKYDLPKKSLVLELTEADAVSDSALAGDVFRKLKNSGVALAFDDFGAGFTCLSNLRKYDFDYLKIDKSFTSDLESGGDGAKIVGSLASLGKDLGLKVIVEGIESKSASSKARHIGCAYAQGYAFGKPLLVEPPKVEAAPVVEAQTEFSADQQDLSAKKDSPPAKETVSEAASVEAENVQETPSERKLEVSFSGGDEEPKSRGWRLWRGERDLR